MTNVDPGFGIGGGRGALDAALDRVWDVLGDRSSLFPFLASDAVAARATSGELPAATPRLLELVVADEITPVAPHAPFQWLAEQHWWEWSAPQRRAIEQFADTWWTMARTSESGSPSVDRTLGCIANLGVPMIRWLAPWLDDLDGPAARHLAALVIDEPQDPSWDSIGDLRGQVLAWARSEPVVIGLALVGGVHLDPGVLGQALDRLL